MFVVTFSYAYEVSCRTRTGKVALRNQAPDLYKGLADSPQSWVPRYRRWLSSGHAPVFGESMYVFSV